MRVSVKNRQPFSAAGTMTLALCNLYQPPSDSAAMIQNYRLQATHPSVYLKECTQVFPDPGNTIQVELRKMFPVSKRIKIYIQAWGMQGPSHYVILHRVTHPTANIPVFQLGCDRLLSCTLEHISLIDGALISWTSSNPEIACGQQPLVTRALSVAASTLGAEILESPELQRELRLCAEVTRLYASYKQFSVWGHPGRATFTLGESGPPVLVNIKPYAATPTKPNVIIWGDVPNNALPDAPELSRHLVPQIKNTQPFTEGDALLTNLLRYALEARLLPFLAISTSNTRGDIYSISYDQAEAFPALLATNHKITGLPRVLQVNNEGTPVYVPDPLLAEKIKQLFFDKSGGEAVYSNHIHSLRMLLRTMGYSTWEHVALAFKNWRVMLTLDEKDALEGMRLEYGV